MKIAFSDHTWRRLGPPDLELCFLEQALPGLRAHQVDQHVQGGGAQVHAGSIGEVLVNVLQCNQKGMFLNLD